MTKYIILSISLLTIFSACKPEKSPEPNTIVVKSTIKITLEKNTYVIDEVFIPKAIRIQGSDTTKNIAAVWSIIGETVASVGSDNKVTILKEGTFKLIASFQSLNDTLLINAIKSENKAKEIKISLSKSEIAKNDFTTLSVSIFDDEQNAVDLENTSYKVENDAIGTFDSEGKFTAKAFGETKIWAESNGLFSEKLSISVFRTGIFVGKEGHSSSGDVTFVSRGGQLQIVTGSNFTVQGGPDLRFYLSNVENGSTVNTMGLELSLLQANSGVTTYTVPRDVKINDYQYIIIQCKQYKTTFGSAKLN